MLELVPFGYAAQIFLMAMAAINIIMGMREVIVHSNNVTGSKLVVYGMIYALVSMLLGMYMLSLLK